MKINYDAVDCYRIVDGKYGTKPKTPYGAFRIPFGSYNLSVLATDGKGIKPQWEHVSVSLPNRCPNWKEMSYIKNLFWDEEETVIQIHPPKSKYINIHPHCLHLWKNPKQKIILPPGIYVGEKENEKPC